MFGDKLEIVRSKRPLVHCITNAVTVNGCANILLAAGAACAMAHHPKEAAEVTAGCDALVCNLGATEAYEAILAAAKASTGLRHPIVVDPVGTGCSSYRRGFFEELSESAEISCIRGNLSEIQALLENRNTAAGIDVGRNTAKFISHGRIIDIAKRLAQRQNCIVILSGRIDVVTNGRDTWLVKNGTEQMTQITGTGCMSSALLGAYLGAETSGKSWLDSCAAAVAAMGICGELAAAEYNGEAAGNMSFYIHLIDQMSLLKKEGFEKTKQITKEIATS